MFAFLIFSFSFSLSILYLISYISLDAIQWVKLTFNSNSSPPLSPSSSSYDISSYTPEQNSLTFDSNYIDRTKVQQLLQYMEHIIQLHITYTQSSSEVCIHSFVLFFLFLSVSLTSTSNRSKFSLG